MRKYLEFIKPGIIFGNGIAVVAGYFLGSQGSFDGLLFAYTMVGISLVIASGGAWNNVIDRDIDAVMERTQKRVLVRGLIPLVWAGVIASLLGILGLVILAYGTNALAVTVASGGWLIYVGLYTIWLKRSSIHGTLIGSLSGAVPPAVGYCAVANRFDLPIILLVLAMCFWQMPHSYAIGIYRETDFRAARIPLFPLIKSALLTKMNMLFYAVGFVVFALLLTGFGYTGMVYGLVIGTAGFLWIGLIVAGFWANNDAVWARKVFITSILLVTLLSLCITLNVQIYGHL